MQTTEKLALDGGPRVRTEPLPVGRGLSVFGQEEMAAAVAVLNSRSLFRYYGPELLRKVEAFERAAIDALGASYAVATASGTAALRAGLAALGVGCGDEVIVPSLTFIATINAVVVAGAVPVFAEIDDTLGLDPADIAAKVTSRTAAIIPVHLDNGACDMDPIMDVAGRHHLPVLEDAAQAMGMRHRGRALGTIGTMGAFSLQLEKNVTSGEGGLILTDDETLFLRAACYQDQGGQFVTSSGAARGRDYPDPFVGENLRMTEIAGAIAEVQLRKLPELLAGMRANAERIRSSIDSLDGITFRRDPGGDGSGSSIGIFMPTPDLATSFIRAMRAEGVPVGQLYGGKPVYLTPSVVDKRTASGKGGPWNCAEHPTTVEYGPGLCPLSENLAARSVLIPVNAAYTPRDCDDVAAAVKKVAGALC
ncbi:MAG: aminotransferase class I/II-fold pyridoxal phosphate-dependent enzyme [Nocardiopsaceae bacterium]|jgi:dTDP-4-amino-4,6-dideoxygalactose transaminase|nr:aminotransferase class I/II-fold pyridoxal phosphate-dependent enzyme [Nocardiopsaceae bacterium]